MSALGRWTSRLVAAVFVAVLVGPFDMVRADQTLVAPSSSPGVVGRLNLGQSARGSLAGSGQDDDVPYHTYIVDVPDGTSHLVVRLSARKDLDIAIKHGAPIEDYDEDDPDWDLVDRSEKGNSTLMIESPSAGKWYIDIMNALFETDDARYTLSVSTKP